LEQQAGQIVELLKTKGLRVTPQRYAIYANLLSRNDHPTVERLLVDLNESVPTSSQATIYSALQVLRDAGLVREVLLEEGICRYDANMAAHHHFRCRCCGGIEDISWQQLSNINFQGLRPGLHIDSYEVIVHGTCDRCIPAKNPPHWVDANEFEILQQSGQ